MPSKLDKVLEGYKPIPMKRMFYPRGMRLSEDFVNAFHREYDRLVDEGLNPRSLVERFGKAMKFHVNETRKYLQLDEEKAKLQEAKKSWQKKQGKAADRRKGKEQAQEPNPKESDGGTVTDNLPQDGKHRDTDSGIKQS